MDEKLKNQSVQTYVEDMTKVLASDKEGLIKKLIHEQEKRDDEKRNSAPESQRNKMFLLLGSILLLLAAVAIGAFLILKENIFTIDAKLEFKPIIFTDATGFREIAGFKKDDIADNVSNAVSTTKVSSGQIEGIYLTEDKKIIGLRKLIALTKGSFVPGDEIYISDNFLIGAMNTGDPGNLLVKNNLFFLLKVRSFTDTFPLLRNWENKMFFDLHGFFGIALTEENKYLLTQPFTDTVVQNKNARVLYDRDGKIVFFYIFADENSIVITDSETVLSEVMTRLTSSEIKK